MKKYVIMTALALVLAAPSAYAEYTGGGAMASGPSAPLVSAPPPAQSSGVGDTMKEKWDKFKDDHEATWEKLEAERRARWHGVTMHVSKGDATDSKSSESEPQKMPASSSQPATDSGFTPPADVSSSTADGGQRPSRWENFKDKHQAGLASAHDHLVDAKSKIHEDVQKVKDNSGDWKDKAHDKADAVKDKYHDWKDEHSDAIDGVKDKWHAWKDKHISQ